MGRTIEAGFTCFHCGKPVSKPRFIGTAHRNHCPFCLWSKHADFYKPGDRESTCDGPMEPIGLTFKRERPDKYHPEEKGELMIVHRCLFCGKISANRIAADDDPKIILSLIEKSSVLNKDTLIALEENGIKLASENDLEEIKTQLFGHD